MPHPTRILGPDAEVTEDFRPRRHVSVAPVPITVTAIVLAVGAALLLDGTGRLVALAGIAAPWVRFTAGRLAAWSTTQYAITNERAIFRAGVPARSGKEIPLEVVDEVAFHRTPLERLIRSGVRLVESAAELGQSCDTDVREPGGLQSVIYQAQKNRAVGESGSTRSIAAELETPARLGDRGTPTEDEFRIQKSKHLGDEKVE